MTGAKPATGIRAWQRMLSGRRLDLLDPSPMDVELSDIAHGLARVARWNGLQNPDCSATDCQMALLHDAPEYVIGDMISPFKAVVGGGYKAVEQRLEAAIHLRFSLPPHPTAGLKALIKKADAISAYFEATRLAGFSEAEAKKFFGQPRGVTADMIPIRPMATAEAQALFCRRFAEIEAWRHEG